MKSINKACVKNNITVDDLYYIKRLCIIIYNENNKK